MRLLALAGWLLAVVVLALPAHADEIPVPSQAEWSGTKKAIELASGVTLAYVELGDPDGKPTLLIHGYTDNSRSWSLLAPYLKGRHLFAIDLRGHGKSSAPDCCYAVTDFANDAYLFLQAKGIEKADVIGHSLGSLTAQMLAAQHPDKVNKIVLISSTTFVGAGPGSWLWDNVMPLTAPIDPNSKFMIDWYWNPNPVTPDFIDRERTESAEVPIQVWHGVLWGLSTVDLRPIEPLIKAPVLILWGDQDQLFDAKHQDGLKTAFPAAQHETFAGAGHNMFWEFPEKVGSIVNAFLGK